MMRDRILRRTRLVIFYRLGSLAVFFYRGACTIAMYRSRTAFYLSGLKYINDLLSWRYHASLIHVWWRYRARRFLSETNYLIFAEFWQKAARSFLISRERWKTHTCSRESKITTVILYSKVEIATIVCAVSGIIQRQSKQRENHTSVIGRVAMMARWQCNIEI